MVLPLVTIGDPEFAVHDWNAILGTLGLLGWDTTIASIVRFVGWTGMALTPVVLVVGSLRKPAKLVAHNTENRTGMPSVSAVHNPSIFPNHPEHR
jgi:hypothetical protein